MQFALYFRNSWGYSPTVVTADVVVVAAAGAVVVVATGAAVVVAAGVAVVVAAGVAVVVAAGVAVVVAAGAVVVVAAGAAVVVVTGVVVPDYVLPELPSASPTVISVFPLMSGFSLFEDVPHWAEIVTTAA